MSTVSGWEVSLVALYFTLLLVLSIFGVHRSWLVWQCIRFRHKASPCPPMPADVPRVLIQLPLYNERYVATRLIEAVARIQYPATHLEIQVLDDSTDDTPEIVGETVAQWAAKGLPIRHLRRGSREGFKAGALAWGLEHSHAELVAIFDADFIPQPDFLLQTVGYFADPAVGMVQTRWDHLNRDYSLLTRTQSVLLDGHFVIEHTARNRSGCFFNFNGTAGIWRRKAIETAGGWQHDTLTEDLDLSYRAQAIGWRFIYLPEVTTPAEVPVAVADFKTQQHRWTKGAVQTARKLLVHLWRAPIPLRCKIEASFHMGSHICYLLMVLMVFLLGPVCLARMHVNWAWLTILDIPILLTTTVSLVFFYFQAERAIGGNIWRVLSLMPAVLCLGIGISINNSLAVIEGWFQNGGEFVRTPKYRIESRRDTHRGKQYAHYRQRILPWFELIAFIYSLGTGVACVLNGLWLVIPFLCLFIFGYGYVVVLTWLDHLRPALAPAPSKG